MNNTTPVLLSSMRFFSVVFSPSLVSISPPKPSRVMKSATATLVPEEEPFAVECFFSGAVAFALDAEELLFFNGGGAAGSAGGALRLRNSTILSYVQKCSLE